MRLRARLRDEVQRIGRRAPGCGATQSRVVAAAPARRGIDHLSVHIDAAAVAVGAGDDVAEIGCRATIVLIMQTAATAFLVANVAGTIDGSRARRGPIEPVEDKQDNPPLAGIGSGLLQ